MSRTRVYDIWCGIVKRCEKVGSTEYHRYGARGIRLCERWRQFENFYADMGEPGPHMEIDRIDPNGDYEPGNCRWASDATQARNQRRTKLSMEKAREIRKLRSEGWTYKGLAARFNVSEGSIGFVLSGRQWWEEAA